MELMTNYNDAVQKLYDHVGFKEDWVLCPIDDCTDKFWSVDDEQVKFANSEEQFNSDGDYYQDEIYKQRFYSKWVYEGKELTMIFCNTYTDGVCWFRVFDNGKRKM